jgi:prepilin-type N-terminal cleavage/methylation domain-containing protein
MRRRRQSAAFSLIELLIVISLMGIMAALTIPNANTGLHDRLQGAAHIVAADLAYVRSLAVTNNSRYRLTFDIAQNRYLLEHSGAVGALDVLPSNPFHATDDVPTRQTIDLDDLPSLGGGASLLAVRALSKRSSGWRRVTARRGDISP